MNLSFKRLLRSSSTLLGCGLAVFAAAIATAEPAAAQRRSQGDVWQVTGTKVRENSRTSVSIGSQGASLRASYGQRGISQRHDGHSHGTQRDFRRGHYQTRSERYWVPAFDRQVWVPARYEWHRDFCGNRTRVLVQAGHYRTECVPGHYDTRSVQVWVPAQSIQPQRIQPQRIHVRGSHHAHQRDRVTHVGRRYRR